MADSDKQEKIIAELKRRAQEVRYGSMTIELKIHEGSIMAGEIVEQTIKLG